MKKLLLAFIMLTAFSSFVAAATVTFYFYDIETEQSLDSVNVILNGTSSYVLNSGDYLSMSEGVWNITVSKAGYKNSTLILNITGNTTINVYLEQENSTSIITSSPPEFQAPELAMNVTGIFTKWIGGEYLMHLFNIDLDAMLADYFSNPPLPGLGILTALMLFIGASLATYAYFKEPEHTWIAGNLVYFGLKDYLPGFTPAILLGPLALFNLYLGYQAFLKYARKLGGR